MDIDEEVSAEQMIELEDIIPIILELPRDGENPEGLSGCQYTSGIDGSHCIVGEILTRLNLPVPDAAETNTLEISYVFEKYPGMYDLSKEAKEFLIEIQTRADTMLHTWGECVDETLKKWLIDHPTEEIVDASA